MFQERAMFTYDATRARIPARTAEHGAQPRVARHAALLVSIAGTLGRVRAAVASRHDTYVRREIAEHHERLAHHREVGGDFHVLP
jgi:hypothetical protein